MENENNLFSNNELAILRRYCEIEKDNLRKGYAYWQVDPLAKKEGNFDLWKKFQGGFAIASMNGGPYNYWEYCDKTLFPGSWADTKQRVTWSVFDRDEVMDLVLTEKGFYELLG